MKAIGWLSSGFGGALIALATLAGDCWFDVVMFIRDCDLVPGLASNHPAFWLVICQFQLLVYATGGVLLIVGVAGLYAGFFVARPVAPGRCPCCGYDVSHSPSSVCSECGRSVPSGSHCVS